MGVPLILGNRCAFVSSTAGTGTYAVGSALAGWFAPVDAPIASGSRVPYVAVNAPAAPTIVEIGEGILTTGSPWTLTRASIIRTISGGVAGSSAINWPAGTRSIFIAPHSGNIVLYDDDGLLRQNGRGVPAIPTTSSGAGQVVEVNGASGAAYTLPAGGRWFYSITNIINASALWSAFRAVGEAAGGTTVGAAVAGNSWVGFAWRTV